MCAASASHPDYLPSEVANCRERNHAMKEESVTLPCTEPGSLMPWPYLSSFFRCVCENERRYTFQCILCQPKQNLLSASKTSSTNLRTHIQRMHPHKVEEMKKLQKGSRKRSLPAEEPEFTLANVQPSTVQVFQDPAQLFEGPAPVSQSRFNQLIFRFIVQGLHPLNIVERPEFQELFREVIPTRSLMSRQTLAKMVDDEFVCVKSNLCVALEKQEYVATTADVWKSNDRSFLGVTVHWIGQDTLGVNSGVIACRRLEGRRTFGVLAGMLVDVHRDFNIEQKVALTTTDSGSNFAKAFALFADAQTEEREGEEDKDGEDVDEDCLQFSEVTDVLSESDVGDYRLPPHERCACHTLNLVATNDAEEATKSSESFKRISRAAIAKCQALWNMQNGSAEASDIIQEGLGCQLKVPNVTRWNSTFQALERLKACTAGREHDLDEVCGRLDVLQFKKAELTFIQEYVTTMAPLAKALDVLQSGQDGLLWGSAAHHFNPPSETAEGKAGVKPPTAGKASGRASKRKSGDFTRRLYRVTLIQRRKIRRAKRMNIASFFPKRKEDRDLNEVEVFLHSSETSLVMAFCRFAKTEKSVFEV
ncbi:hypothetical protein SKAU_G00297580 [Synaphobranchus kaupii]|uniref:BED-type domain-containing protein n=1 Tax=Synaphobranchus kaupii TaxID=118154 RepID=A0A9Q1IKT0_SYNKA|nr:hypothetical protein SKAU_G00297580 [Synaphobranchus kaupii]